MVPTARRILRDLKESPTQSVMQALINRVRQESLTDEETALLASVLGNSGAVLSHSSEERTADLASTGGPTSLSTLLGPVYLRALGYLVPKVGVSGRPAGGVDVLAQVPGYRVNLSTKQVQLVLRRCGYAHFLADENHAPLDARLFKYRRQADAQSLPDLVIASLLAKKIAVGVQHVGLDIRVAPHGNFGTAVPIAESNAARFSRVATLLGRSATCFLTDASYPYQRYIGRGESLVALSKVFSDVPDSYLQRHVAICRAMACEVAQNHPHSEPPSLDAIKRTFIANLEAQGSSYGALEERVRGLEDGHQFEFSTRRAGRLGVHLAQTRALIGRFQCVGTHLSTNFPDGMGIILQKMPGERVIPGDTLATIRVAEAAWPEVQQQLGQLFFLSSEAAKSFGYKRV